MSTTSLQRRRMSPQRAKQVFKLAILKKPETIEHLKQSLAISVGKYQRFMKYLKDSTELFHTSTNQDVGIASKRKGKQIIKRGKEFRLNTDTSAPQPSIVQREQPMFGPPSRSSSTRVRMPRGEIKTHKTYTSDLFRGEITPTSITAQFWKKIGKGSQKAHRRWKTDVDEKIGENTIGDITRFNEKDHAKAVNFLVLQLQLNIEDSKRCRVKTGIEE